MRHTHMHVRTILLKNNDSWARRWSVHAYCCIHVKQHGKTIQLHHCSARYEGTRRKEWMLIPPSLLTSCIHLSLPSLSLFVCFLYICLLYGVCLSCPRLLPYHLRPTSMKTGIASTYKQIIRQPDTKQKKTIQRWYVQCDICWEVAVCSQVESTSMYVCRAPDPRYLSLLLLPLLYVSYLLRYLSTTPSTSSRAACHMT